MGYISKDWLTVWRQTGLWDLWFLCNIKEGMEDARMNLHVTTCFLGHEHSLFCFGPCILSFSGLLLHQFSELLMWALSLFILCLVFTLFMYHAFITRLKGRDQGLRFALPLWPSQHLIVLECTGGFRQSL